jgi:UDP-GlcNAc:undecaprenyl-phosphate/decaprenyl-phosphate GlcNAc-1-phosphate transferase
MHNALEELFQRSVMSAMAAFALTLGVVMLLSPLAHRWGWVDRPGGRKKHAAATPVVGGLAILLGSIPLAMATFQLTQNIVGLMVAGAIVIAAGVWDDVKDLRWYWRLSAQSLAALTVVYLGGVRVEMIGPLFGGEVESLGFLSAPFTVVATVGIMNALNMADGIDGLAGSLTSATLLMLTVAAVYSGNERLAHGLVLLLGALLAFLAFNLRTPWMPKASIFLGNAGSEFLGLIVAWSCFRLTQNAAHPVTPALAPFLVAPPVIDCLVLMVRRLRNGRSPFAADRNHFHHILLDAGWTTTSAVILIAAISLTMGFGAALALKAHVAPIWLVIAFALITVWYYAVSARRARCVAFLQTLGANLGALQVMGPSEGGVRRAGRSLQRDAAMSRAQHDEL